MNLIRVAAAVLIASSTGLTARLSAAPSNNYDVPASVRLGPEYKQIELFQDFRKRLLADGWTPLRNTQCHDAVMGDFYEEFCSKEVQSVSCRLCDMTPELFRKTSDGYMLMKYTKSGVSLSVTLYGDTRDLDHPGEYGLSIVGWDYEEGMNVQLLD